MVDHMQRLIQFGKHAGELYYQTVSGTIRGRQEAENDVFADEGVERSMYAYAPLSGCPHHKQCQVLMVLRSDSSKESALELMKRWKLDELAEEKHFLLLFPNPTEKGWNYLGDESAESDVDYLIRCFGILRGSGIGVNGFNGMIFYVSACPEASALMMTMAAKKPANVSAMMIGAFPEGYTVPVDALGIETAAWISGNTMAAEYLTKANGISSTKEADGVTTHFGSNPNCRLLITDRPIDAETVAIAWDQLFSETRRWQNDTHGCYQRRTNFTERGFVGHVKDTSLGIDNGFPHTWYEYIPPQLRGTDEKVPLVIYFHGGGCEPLYAAEQSGWHDIAEKENFIAIFPEASQEYCWNMGYGYKPAHVTTAAVSADNSDDCYNIKDEYPFFLALIDHIKTVHPIDETRIYVSGFSRGGGMAHSTAAAYPNLIAGLVGCNAFETLRPGLDPAGLGYSCPVAVFQNVGLIDSLTGEWPAEAEKDTFVTRTIRRWRECNDIPLEPWLDEKNATGLAADESFWEGPGDRFYHQRWRSNAPGNPVRMEMLFAKRMPHAIDLEQMRLAWKFIKKFRKLPDGSLVVDEKG